MRKLILKLVLLLFSAFLAHFSAFLAEFLIPIAYLVKIYNSLLIILI